jgi:two-component system, OmpR family, phosphate regulon sensor histidine kinase PhoR
LSFGGAIVLAVLAALLFRRVGANDPSAWALVAAAVCLVIAGVKARSLIRSQYATLEQRQAQIDRLEQQLQEQRQAVDALADGLEVAIFVCDHRAHILYANRRATDMFRFDQPIGRSILAITLSYDLEQLVLDTLHNRAPQTAEFTFSYPEEQVGMAKAWPAEDNAERAFLSVYEVTDLRRLERVRQDFVANVSHELRTPMTIIRAMAETLLDDERPDPDRMRNYLEKIIAEVDRLSLISSDLLVLSAAESNPVRKHACDIADVFKTVVEGLSKKASEKGLSLTYKGPEACVIAANTSQMSQVALNLVDNAINYTVEGSVEVELLPGDVMVEVIIRDTGLGIASEHQPRIFERFYRVDKGRSRTAGGTGLGLSIVRHIVEAHGGTVTVESALNKGSTFTVMLPVGKASFAPEAEAG